MQNKVKQVGVGLLMKNEKNIQAVLDEYNSNGWKLISTAPAHGLKHELFLFFEKE